MAWKLQIERGSFYSSNVKDGGRFTLFQEVWGWEDYIRIEINEFVQVQILKHPFGK